MSISLNPQEYVGRNQDGLWDVSLKKALRQEPEAVRADFLARILVLQEQARLSTRPWFALATSVLQSRESFDLLLRAGLKVANASSMKGWLECCVPRLGVRGAIRVLEQEDEVPSSRVDLTEYWLPPFARTAAEREALDRFLRSPSRRRLGGDGG